MKLSELAISSIETVLDRVLQKAYPWRKVLDVRLVAFPTPDSAHYKLIGTTEANNHIAFDIQLPDNLLRTDTVYGSVRELQDALLDALRGLEATGRLLDSITPKPDLRNFDFKDFEHVLRNTIDKEIVSQFTARQTLYEKFSKGIAWDSENTRSYRMPFYDKEK